MTAMSALRRRGGWRTGSFEPYRRPIGADGRRRLIWGMIGAVNDNPTVFGGLVVELFLTTWAVSYGIYRFKHYDSVEALVKAQH